MTNDPWGDGFNHPSAVRLQTLVIGHRTLVIHQTSTGPLGTGIAVRCATPGSCMKLATIGGG